MRRFAYLCRAFLIITCAAAATLASAADRPWRVVILNASDPTLPAFIAIDRATRAEFAKPGNRAVEVYSETLDFMRFLGAQLEPAALALLRLKYRELPVDAVIAIAPDALHFADRYRAELWPEAVIVFHTIPQDAMPTRGLPPKATGIIGPFDFAATGALALQLRPNTRRLVVIGGSGEFDRLLAAIAKSRLAPLGHKVEVQYWSDLGIGAYMDRVARLPGDSAVLVTSIFRDADGRQFTPRDALMQLAAASTAPVYGIFDTYVGGGSVAGYVEDYDQLGRRAAQLVRQTLATPAGMPLPPVETRPAVCVADARELRRWSIPEGRLPEDCTVRFSEVPVWRRYWWQIAIAMAIIVSQSSLLVALLLQRRRRQRAEVDTHAARTELAHASRLVSLGELTASIAHEIKQPLSAILAHADTAELLLESPVPPVAEIQQIVANIRSDDLRANEVITRLHDLLGKHAMERNVVDVNGVIADTLHLLETEARRRGVTVDTGLEPALPPIVGDRVHLQQVVLNLVLNAMDAVAAMPEDARRLMVTTVARPDRVEIAVADRGPGIDPKIAARLFDSFVTTKARGLGLGLSIVRSIVEAHGGAIEATNRGGGGALFRVTIPRAGTGAGERAASIAP